MMLKCPEVKHWYLDENVPNGFLIDNWTDELDWQPNVLQNLSVGKDQFV